MNAPSTAQQCTVTRRPATAADQDLLRELFEQSRDDLQLLPPALLELQYRARANQHAQDHPSATQEILVVDGSDAGMLLLAVDDAVVRMVDIVIAPAQRRRGIAECLLRDVITKAGARPVQLTVWSANVPARAHYEQLGFAAIAPSPGQAAAHGESATLGYVAMERAPGPIDRSAGDRITGRCA
jgi:ribosomal protein S18 acetylase RimI-like enzyme